MAQPSRDRVVKGETVRLRATIHGAVQGVGFRPFVYRLATELGLAGWVRNSSEGVLVEVEGPKPLLDAFLLRLQQDQPPRASIQSLECSFLDPVGCAAFEIRESLGGPKTALVLPDIATCPDCLREILDPANRRYRYPFTNCTNCGPRFTIVQALPYDRPNTTMKRFTMCEQCQAEYDDPRDRRFHAQPNACPACGPRLELWTQDGTRCASHEEALAKAADALRQGRIVALKGLGGFHLMVDARSEEAVRRLRLQKRREEKPFALMYPTLDMAKAHCNVSTLEARLLVSPESPIVLLERKGDAPGAEVAPSVAPQNPFLGVMLPYTPLHHLLLLDLGFPVVATSGNVSEEPICIDAHDALERLGGMADLFLVHNRPIARHADDSIVRVIMGRELVVRRARGYAPLPVPLPERVPSFLAVGGQLKNTIALSVGDRAFVSQHIGDLDTARAVTAFHEAIAGLGRIYDAPVAALACDAHPDYNSTHFAHDSGRPVFSVQHHYAHVLACMAENEVRAPVLGVAWDGTGYGADGTVWGGEFLRVNEESFERVAHLRTFRLPGGDKAVKEPRRAALGLLYELLGPSVFSMEDLAPIRALSAQGREVLRAMLEKGVNAPTTSSAGRLFDAVAAIVNLRQETHFEGQAAMALEFALAGIQTDEAYDFGLNHVQTDRERPTFVVDWAPMMQGILEDVRGNSSVGEVSARFHNALVNAICAVADRVGEERVMLTGGCFQNRYLTERSVAALERAGFRPYWHQRIPPNDGGIAIGQIVAASREYRRR